jgi:hypothetical protein
MGAIQNAINQAGGAIAGAALGVKHAKEQQVSNALAAQHQALIAESQATDLEKQAAEATINELKPGGLLDQEVDATIAEKNAMDKYSNFVQNASDKQKGTKRFQKTEEELARKRYASVMAVKALEIELQNNDAIKQRAEQQREYARSARAIADKKAKFLGGSK